MVRWHYQLNGHEFEQTLGDGEAQGILACCNLWGHKELGTTQQLKNNNEKKSKYLGKIYKDSGAFLSLLQDFVCLFVSILRAFYNFVEYYIDVQMTGRDGKSVLLSDKGEESIKLLWKI